MSNLLVIHKNINLIQEQEDVLNQLNGWSISFMDTLKVTLKEIDSCIKEEEVHFLLYSKEFDSESSNELLHLHNKYPLMQIIYYYPQLKSGEFAELANVGINYCIIGDARQINLLKKLYQLWESHWKRIPTSFLPDNLSIFTPRIRMIVKFIEQRPIRELTTCNLARHLNLSESHFRTEFKKFFNISFREFKQKLFRHYESVLLLEKHIKPKHVFEILNYKNLSAFSRSFKSRHGETWQKLVKNSA